MNSRLSEFELNDFELDFLISIPGSLDNLMRIQLAESSMIVLYS